jgi:hypothetical protein
MNTQNLKFKHQFAEEEKAMHVFQDKALKFDAVCNERDFYKDEVINLRLTLSDQYEMTRRLAEAERERELFQRDKLYLHKELDNAVVIAENSRKRHEATESRCLNLERQINEMRDRLANQSNDALHGDKNRLELDNLRDLILREADTSRLIAEQSYDREIRGLHEKIMCLQTDLSSLQKDNTSLKIENEKKEAEQSSKLQRRENEYNDLKSSLKMKVFELTSHEIIFQERMAQLRRKETENR